MCGEYLQCLGHTGFAPAMACMLSVYTAQAPICSAGKLSKAGPGLHAFPRSMLLRFRFSGTPQRHRLCWVCVLCPSQVQAVQMTRCLASALSPISCGAYYHLPGPSRLVSRMRSRSALSGVPCVSSGELISGSTLLADVDSPESQEVLVSNEACLQFGR